VVFAVKIIFEWVICSLPVDYIWPTVTCVQELTNMRKS
jgi:hypothetical protein